MRTPLGAAVVACVAVTGTACGGGGGEDMSDVATTARFEVVATEMAFAPSRAAVAAGRVTVTMHNEGAIRHDLRIDEQPFLVEAEAGHTETATIALSPGRYEFFCSLPGHRQAGMEGILEVR